MDGTSVQQTAALNAPSQMGPTWFRYRLRTLFLVITFVCIAIGWEVNVVHQRRLAREWLAQNRWTVMLTKDWFDPPTTSVPLWRRWLGDEAVWYITPPGECMGPYPYSDDLFLNDRARMERIFPEAVVGPAREWP